MTMAVLQGSSDPSLGPPPPLDIELAEPLANILATRAHPLTPELIAASRAASLAARISDAEITRAGRFELLKLTTPVPGAALPALLCRPPGRDKPHPVIFHVHGGGMVAGDYRSAELASDLDRAESLGMAVFAVNYRLAPEHPHPTPVEDCFHALTWLLDNAEGLRLDPRQIVLCGNSAGGGLAAGLALLARDRGLPPLLGQMLQCPMLDDRAMTSSARQLHDVGLWDGRSNMVGWTALLGARCGGPDVPAYAAPARASDLSGLAPTFIDVGAVEALRDEAVAFASRIWACGGDAELHVWSGAFHSFDQWVPSAVVSRAANNARIAWLSRRLHAAEIGP